MALAEHLLTHIAASWDAELVRFTLAQQVQQTIDGSKPMQNNQAYSLSDIFLKFYNIIKNII
jgi:hypothetical protein